MKVNSLVECLFGHENVLEQGSIYTVSGLAPNGGVTLYEATPPFPYKSFGSWRFKELQSDDDFCSIMEDILEITEK